MINNLVQKEYNVSMKRDAIRDNFLSYLENCRLRIEVADLKDLIKKEIINVANFCSKNPYKPNDNPITS